jgi:hypothetical protein
MIVQWKSSGGAVSARSGCERPEKVMEDLDSDQDAVYGSTIGSGRVLGCFDASW